MKRILLVRHGQTDWNVAGRWQGHEDIPLNATGLEQARALAEHLRSRPISAIYTSDLKRAQLTASTIAEAHSLTLKIDPRWRELHLGVFQGLTTNEINAKYPVEARRMREDYMDYQIPTGETRRAMQARAIVAYQQILKDEPGDEIVVVSHGGTIRIVLLKLFGDEVLHRSIHNTSISTIETDGTSATLIDTGLTPHLNN